MDGTSSSTFDRLPLSAKICYVLRHLTVEPLIIFYSLAYAASIMVVQNFNIEKGCRVNLHFNDTLCTAMLAKGEGEDQYCEKLYELQEKNLTGPDPWRNTICGVEDKVQDIISKMGIWRTFLSSFFPMILIIFIGSWTDRHRKRKPAMLIPLIADIVTAIGFIVCNYFFYELPMEVSGLWEATVPAVTGSWVTVYMAVFSYIGEVSSVETRTFRIGLVNVCASVSVSLGTLVSGNLYGWIGYYGTFGVTAGLSLTAFILGWVFVPKENKPLEEKTNNTIAFKEQNRPGLVAFLKDFFDLKNVRDVLAVVFKKGRHNHLLRVVFLLINVVLVLGPWQGEMTVMYNFTRLRFNWNEVDYSYFLTFIMVINLIGTSITVGVFSQMLKMDDAIIGIISCVSKILAGFIYAFATTTWVIYLAPLVDIANGTSYIAMRSIASKLVPPDELGKLNSVFGMAEAVVPVIYGPMYSAIYNATRQTVPGAFFLIGGALTAPAVFIFLWLYGQHRQDAVRLEEESKKKKDSEQGNQRDKTDVLVEKERNGTFELENKQNAYTNGAFEENLENSKL